MFDDYTVDVDRGFDETVVRVLKALEKRRLRVLHIHDVQAFLAQNGISIKPLKIIEFCSQDFAAKLLQTDVKMSLLMPCKICVYVKRGKTYISTLRPRAIGDYYPKLAEVVGREDKLNLSTVNEAKYVKGETAKRSEDDS